VRRAGRPSPPRLARSSVTGVYGACVEFVDVCGGRVWTETSDVGGVPVLLCHGGPGAYDYLEPVAAMLDDLALVHRFDQRGGGRSNATGPWTVQAMVNDIECLRRHWRHEHWLVAGQSWGAHLALFYALAFPRRTHGLVLLNSTGLRWGWGAERRERRMPRLTEHERDEAQQLERVLATRHDDAARERLRELIWLTDFADRDNATRSPRYDAYPRDPAIVEALEQSWQERLASIEPEVAGLDVPALVLHGAADPIGETGPREFARLLPQGRFVVLPGVGHMPWLEDPSELRRQLRMFARRLHRPVPRRRATSHERTVRHL
jgi:proline iminopeptidase